MTDLVPTTTTSAPVLRSARAVTLPAQAPAQPLSEIERICNMIASGGELTPPAYRGKPGAVLLAKLWGDANGVDLFTAIQNISPIEGRPYVSAEMRVALAVAKGFEFRTIEATREVCTLEVWRGSERLGSVTARFSDQPRKLKTAKGYDTPWATHPDDMLFAEACRKADRRHVRTAAALLDTSQDYDVTSDPLMVLAAQGAGLAADPAEVAEPAPGGAPAGVVDAEIVEDQGDVTGGRLAHLLAKASAAELKEASVLKEANARARALERPPVASLADLAHPVRAEIYDDVLDWIEGL